AVRGARDLLRHHVHGHGRGRVLPGGRDARGAARARERGGEGGGHLPAQHAGRAHHASGRRIGGGGAPGVGGGDPGRRRRVQRGRRRRVPVAARPPAPARGPTGPLLAVVHRVAGGCARRIAAGHGAPQPAFRHDLARSVRRPPRGGAAYARSVAARDQRDCIGPDAGAARVLDAVRARARAQPRRQRGLGRRAPAPARRGGEPGRRAGVPGRRRGGGASDRSAGLGGAGPRAGDALRARAPVLPDRAVPAEQRRPARPRARPRRHGHCARCRHSDGAHLRASGGRPGRRVGRSARPSMTTLDQSYARCRELNKAYGTTYYAATFLLPRVKRHYVHALYGFCRHADDIVDDLGPAPVEVREKALADFGERFFADLTDGDSDDPVLKAVVHTVKAFGIDPGCFQRFLRSMTMDLTVSTYDTFDDLLDYMDGSAAVIGEMMLPILEPKSGDAARHARDLGIAFQLTNFLRDVREDLERGRVYIPQDDLERFGVNL